VLTAAKVDAKVEHEDIIISAHILCLDDGLMLATITHLALGGPTIINCYMAHSDSNEIELEALAVTRWATSVETLNYVKVYRWRMKVPMNRGEKYWQSIYPQSALQMQFQAV